MVGDCQQAPTAMAKLLGKFSYIFATPSGLPLVQEHDHAIVLEEGTSPISVRPYRYPQIMKNEIERLVAEILAAGIIQLSTNSFSSPVLLVKKKDDSWRLCVDYRVLN